MNSDGRVIVRHVSLCHILSTKLQKKNFTLSPTPAEKLSVSVPLSFWLVTCKTIETGQFSKTKSPSETYRRVKSTFFRWEGWLTLVNDGRWCEGHQLDSFFLSFFPTRSWLPVDHRDYMYTPGTKREGKTKDFSTWFVWLVVCIHQWHTWFSHLMSLAGGRRKGYVLSFL